MDHDVVPGVATPHRPRRAVGLLAALAIVAVLAAPGRASASVALNQVGFDRYSNPDAQHRTTVEPDTFAFRSTIVSAFQVGRFSSGGATGIGWATSTDAGATWTTGFLPAITRHQRSGAYDRVTDPSVAFDARHNVWLVSSLVLFDTPSVRPVSVVASRSTNGGTAWGAPVPIGGTNPDKNWTVCDNWPRSPYYGNCYTEWTEAVGSVVYMSTSSDGGLTWGPPQATANRASGVGGQPVVQPNGTVVVPIDNAAETGVLAFRSTDGGATWSSTVAVATIAAHRVAGGLRSGPLISAEVDGSGRVYVVWHDCRFQSLCAGNDIVLTSSIDGVMWSPVTRIPIGDTSGVMDRFIPGLAVDRTTTGTGARLALTYHYYPQANCTSSTCQLMVGFVSSADAGATWSAPIDLAGPMLPTWLPLTSSGYMVGDYISTSFAGGTAHPVFSVARAPSGGVLDQAMYSPVQGLPVGPPPAAR